LPDRPGERANQHDDRRQAEDQNDADRRQTRQRLVADQLLHRQIAHRQDHVARQVISAGLPIDRPDRPGEDRDRRRIAASQGDHLVQVQRPRAIGLGDVIGISPPGIGVGDPSGERPADLVGHRNERNPLVQGHVCHDVGHAGDFARVGFVRHRPRRRVGKHPHISVQRFGQGRPRQPRGHPPAKPRRHRHQHRRAHHRLELQRPDGPSGQLRFGEALGWTVLSLRHGRSISDPRFALMNHRPVSNRD
jgi:hypothetical protein